MPSSSGAGRGGNRSNNNSSSSNPNGINIRGKAARNRRVGAGGGGGGAAPGTARVRKAADYTPVQEPRADQETIGEAARLAVERAKEEQERRQRELAAAVAAAASSNGEGTSGHAAAAHGTTPLPLDEEPETCYICAEPIKYFVLGTCSHRTCHVCSLRLRALYKKKECTFCKIDLPSLICTTDPSRAFQDFPPDAFPYSDAKLGIAFETSEMMEDTLTLLRFNCPQMDCDYLGSGWQDLKKHARSAHDLVFCDLCIKNKKIFTHEHSLFTPHGLTVHVRDGDPQPTSSDDPENTGFTGHPSCEFCRIPFYDSDQLFLHCRDKHEQCFICIRNGTGRYQYYIDYPHLETHFQAAHYLCLNPACLEQRFIVFDTEIDLQAHQLSTHGGTAGSGGGGSTSKTSRRLETNFTYTPSHDPRAGGGVQMQPRRRAPQAENGSSGGAVNHHGSHSGGTAGGSIELVPVASSSSSTNGVLNSRGRVVPGLQRGGFNTSLSDNAPSSARKQEKKPAHDDSSMSASVTGIKQTDPIMAARHASLLTRVSEAVGGSEAKLAAYRAAVRTYRASESSANDLIKTVHALLDNQTDVTARIITSTADLLDNPEKRDELSTAWGLYQANLLQSADSFPSLVPTAPSHGTFFGGPSASRPSSRPSSRTQVRKTVSNAAKQSNSAVWARVEQAAANKNVGAVPGLTARAVASSSKDKFPALPSSKNAVSSHAVRGATPWASTRQQATSPGSTYFPVASSASSSLLSTPVSRSPAFGRPAPKPSAVPAAEFPSLPTSSTLQARSAQKAAIFGKTTPPASSWGATSPPASLEGDFQSLQMGEGSGSSGGPASSAGQSATTTGKKKKGKQVLLHYGL